MYTTQEKTIANRFVNGGVTNIAALTAPPPEDPVEALKRRLESVEIDGQRFFVAEGDLLLDEDELVVYALQRQAQDLQKLIGTVALSERSGELLGIVVGNKLVRWQVGLTLTYCVLR